MEQRPLRLGDILDDYCPRERRVTNHAVVAMIDDTVKQTRCTTCDAEHPYKGGQAPRRRSKKEAPAALYKEVLAGKPEDPPAIVPVHATETEPPSPPPIVAAEDEFSAHTENAEIEIEPVVEADGNVEVPSESVPDAEEGPVHRPLIRATLPRP